MAEVGGTQIRIMQKIWEIAMINLNKFVVFVLCSLYMQISWAAGEAVIFDRSELIAFDENNVIAGYYNAQGDRKSCLFLFAQVDQKMKGETESPYSEVKILTFVPGEDNFAYQNRDKMFDISGALYRRDETWLIRTDEEQAGCENALGEFTTYPRGKVGGEIFSMQKRVPAIGIRLVSRKSYFYDLRDGKFVARKGYLTKWNGVIVLDTHEQFSYVRFADSRVNVVGSARVTTGWVHSTDLVNPFPVASMQ
jgi:hypothetical protein